MKKNTQKTLLALLLILGGVGFLIMKGVSDTGVYYRTVAEIIEDGLPRQRGVRVSGSVLPGTIDYDQQRLLLRFTVRDTEQEDKTMQVLYRGVRPDAFREEAEVILEGRLDGAGQTFVAETLLAKCPSKYESEVRRQ
ncbi:MAG TPA: cytochrome c maturation protein CcmE [Desulfobulbus sp.]|nr:cytochrome c maturation protein CcmE [Desulfobulbus sp.]